MGVEALSRTVPEKEIRLRRIAGMVHWRHEVPRSPKQFCHAISLGGVRLSKARTR